MKTFDTSVLGVAIVLVAAIAATACPGCSSAPSQDQVVPEGTDGGPEEEVASPDSSERAVLYDDAVDAVSELVPMILSDTAVEQSDLAAMSNLAEMLKEDGIRAGLVRIEDDSHAEGNLDACVAIDTVDRAVVYLYVMPSDLDVQPPEERVQTVYLEEGSRVGLIAARFADSTDYAWYVSYLDELYEHYDGWNWLSVCDTTLADYSAQLDRAIDYVEYPPGLTRDLTSREWEKYDDLIRLIDDGVDEYNRLIETYNAEWEMLEAESPLYPEQLFYIETTWSDPFAYPLFTLPDPPAMPIMPATPVPSTITPGDYLSTLESLASVPSPSLPDTEQYRYERITDNNFVVVDFDVDW